MKKGVLICFFGIDGSGKSTLSRYLFEELKKRAYDVSYVWWLEGDNSLLRKLLRRIGGRYRDSGENHPRRIFADRKSATARLFNAFFPRVVLLDYLRFGIVKAWFPKIVRSKVLIFDRYIYDVILGLSREFNFKDAEREKMVKTFSKLLPNPDLVFIVDVPPEVSYSRRKDEIKSIEEAGQIWEEYQRFYPLLGEMISGKIVKINNTRDIASARAEVLKATMEVLRAGKNGK